MGLGNLVNLTDSPQALLEAAFSAELANADHKRQVEHIGVPDCDSIQSLKLDSVIQVWFQHIPSVTEQYFHTVNASKILDCGKHIKQFTCLYTHNTL